MDDLKNDDLFGSLDNKVDFLSDQTKKVNSDGIYRIDMQSVKDKNKGYRSVIRFLPNLTVEGVVGQSAIEKISHYVDIKNPKELSGYFDSPKNFNEKCSLTDLYYQLDNSKNAILKERAKMLKYSKKYYSYVLIMEDAQKPELVGKIMIFSYGKTIRDKILSEKNGEISGKSINIFDIKAGKDFVLLVKEIQTGDETYPDYKMSMFKPETSSLPIYFKEKQTFKNVPLVDGQVDPKAQTMVREFLLDREHNLEDFGAKRLDETQQAKISEIINYMTGKSSQSFGAHKESKPSTSDFDIDQVMSGNTVEEETEDDFFNDL